MYSHKFRTGFLFVSFSLLLFTALRGQSVEEKNMAVMKRFLSEVASQGKLELIDELFADNFVEHESMPGLAEGKEGVKNFFTMFRQGFPDLKFTINDIAAEGDKVWIYVTITGTHSGPFMDMPATGKQISMPGFDLVRLVDGKVVEHWGVTDSMTMMTQLGVIPEK